MPVPSTATMPSVTMVAPRGRHARWTLAGIPSPSGRLRPAPTFRTRPSPGSYPTPTGPAPRARRLLLIGAVVEVVEARRQEPVPDRRGEEQQARRGDRGAGAEVVGGP